MNDNNAKNNKENKANTDPLSGSTRSTIYCDFPDAEDVR